MTTSGKTEGGTRVKRKKKVSISDRTPNHMERIGTKCENDNDIRIYKLLYMIYRTKFRKVFN